MGGSADSEALTLLEPTPECGADEPTPSQTAGPFFKPDSPQRASLLEPGLAGTRLVVGGLVLSTTCKPIAHALLDFWHTDDEGDYDLSGYRMRGHQFSDAAGRFRLETIVPGAYSGRTRHIHVRVQASGGRILFSGRRRRLRPYVQPAGNAESALMFEGSRVGNRRTPWTPSTA